MDTTEDEKSDITFKEEDVLTEQVGEKSAAAFEKADQIAKEIAIETTLKSTDAMENAIKKFQSYVKHKIKNEGGAKENFAQASELVGDLVEVATEMIAEHVPVLGVLMKHGALRMLGAANEAGDLDTAATDLIAELSQLHSNATNAVGPLLEEHSWEVRNAYGAAKDPSEKKAGVKAALGKIGIAVPKPDAGAHIYQALVARLNIDAWIESCRSGKNGKTAECATDAAIPGIEKDAEEESKKAFREDDGKKQKQEKGKAMPMG